VTVYQQTIEFGPDGEICEGSDYVLSASGGTQYEWTGEDPFFQSSLASPIVSPKDTSEFYVTVTNADGCVRKDTTVVNVVPAIDLDFTFRRESTCFDKPLITITNTTDTLMEGDRMHFALSDGVTSELVEFEHEFPAEGVYTITLHGRREFCDYQRSAEIPVFRLTVPNVITPDASPDKNDVFFVGYGEALVAPGDFGYKVSLVVYNRWGRIVYEAMDYRNDWNAEGLPAGVYYYEVNVTDHAICRDWLHIVR